MSLTPASTCASGCLLACLLLAGCTSEYERTYGETEAEYEARASACEERVVANEYIFSFVDTDRWRVGAVPFWSTPERVRSILGAPDSTRTTVIQIEAWPKLDYLVYERSDEGADGRLTVTVVNDSLAYLSHADLLAEPLQTDRGRFAPGVSLAEVREAFPESYECRDLVGFASAYSDRFSPVLVATDTARGARALLLFKDERLVGAATDYYMQEVKHRSTP